MQTIEVNATVHLLNEAQHAWIPTHSGLSRINLTVDQTVLHHCRVKGWSDVGAVTVNESLTKGHNLVALSANFLAWERPSSLGGGTSGLSFERSNEQEVPTVPCQNSTGDLNPNPNSKPDRQ